MALGMHVIGWPGDYPDSLVLGLSIRTWDRIGKGAQFLGGSAALIDLSSERIEATARWLEHAGRNSRTPVVALLVLVPLYLGVWLAVDLLAVTLLPLRGFYDNPSGTSEGFYTDAVLLLSFMLFLITFVPGMQKLVVVSDRLFQAIGYPFHLLGRLGRSPLRLRWGGFGALMLGSFLDFLAS